MTAVGYDDFKQCFIVRNSWGEDWGDKGNLDSIDFLFCLFLLFFLLLVSVSMLFLSLVFCCSFLCSNPPIQYVNLEWDCLPLK